MAAMALVQLRYLDRDNAHRRQLAMWYDELLADVSQVERIPIPSDCESSRHLLQVMVNNRDEVMTKMNARGIWPGMHYVANVDYPMYAYARGTCPRAEQAASRLVSLPLHLRMGRTEVERVVAALVDSVK